MNDAEKNALLRTLPSIDELLSRPSIRSILADHPRPLAVAALRRAVGQVRARLLAGESRPWSDDDLKEALKRLTAPNLRRVLNATGVVLHTNLGRAPLATRAIERIAQVAQGYCNLEYNLEEGERGSRYEPVIELLCELTGAEDALVVNNNAGAVLLVLAALARGREVIVSRGELVEIGGGFRVPEIMKQSGAQLVEVGTTNRTRLADYEKAASEQTGLLLKVHPSNFAIVGFTETVATRELCALARRLGLVLFEDLGSGSLLALAGEGLSEEPTVRSVIEAGADLVSFSGDKLLGGPQAGIVVGKRDFISKVRAHPLNRALRVDKLTVAALEATLELYREGRLDELPAHRLLTAPPEELERRAEHLRKLLEEQGVNAEVISTVAQVGGGAMPLAEPASFACALQASDPREFQARIRSADPPVVARIAEERLLLDVRCLSEDELEAVAAAVGQAFQVSRRC